MKILLKNKFSNTKKMQNIKEIKTCKNIYKIKIQHNYNSIVQFGGKIEFFKNILYFYLQITKNTKLDTLSFKKVLIIINEYFKLKYSDYFNEFLDWNEFFTNLTKEYTEITDRNFKSEKIELINELPNINFSKILQIHHYNTDHTIEIVNQYPKIFIQKTNCIFDINQNSLLVSEVKFTDLEDLLEENFFKINCLITETRIEKIKNILLLTIDTIKSPSIKNIMRITSILDISLNSQTSEITLNKENIDNLMVSIDIKNILNKIIEAHLNSKELFLYEDHLSIFFSIIKYDSQNQNDHHKEIDMKFLNFIQNVENILKINGITFQEINDYYNFIKFSINIYCIELSITNLVRDHDQVDIILLDHKYLEKIYDKFLLNKFKNLCILKKIDSNESDIFNKIKSIKDIQIIEKNIEEFIPKLKKNFLNDKNINEYKSITYTKINLYLNDIAKIQSDVHGFLLQKKLKLSQSNIRNTEEYFDYFRYIQNEISPQQIFYQIKNNLNQFTSMITSKFFENQYNFHKTRYINYCYEKLSQNQSNLIKIIDKLHISFTTSLDIIESISYVFLNTILYEDKIIFTIFDYFDKLEKDILINILCNGKINYLKSSELSQDFIEHFNKIYNDKQKIVLEVLTKEKIKIISNFEDKNSLNCLNSLENILFRYYNDSNYQYSKLMESKYFYINTNS